MSSCLFSQVLLSVDMGKGHSFSARVGLRNKFRFCDNMWHTVKANYIKDSLTLRVDDYREAYGFNGSDNDKATVTGAPLYIGGLPGKCFMSEDQQRFQGLPDPGSSSP